MEVFSFIKQTQKSTKRQPFLVGPWFSVSFFDFFPIPSDGRRLRLLAVVPGADFWAARRGKSISKRPRNGEKMEEIVKSLENKCFFFLVVSYHTSGKSIESFLFQHVIEALLSFFVHQGKYIHLALDNLDNGQQVLVLCFRVKTVLFSSCDTFSFWILLSLPPSAVKLMNWEALVSSLFSNLGSKCHPLKETIGCLRVET